jgi:hypothetical protein
MSILLRLTVPNLTHIRRPDTEVCSDLDFCKDWLSYKLIFPMTILLRLTVPNLAHIRRPDTEVCSDLDFCKGWLSYKSVFPDVYFYWGLRYPT